MSFSFMYSPDIIERPALRFSRECSLYDFADGDHSFYAGSGLKSSARADMSRAWKERPISTFFATGGGIGMIPFAPGTWGSLEGLGIGCLLNAFPSVLACGFALGIVGTWAAGRAESVAGSKDPGPIVIDEVCGQLIASSPAALPTFRSSLWVWLASFLLFRLFDIWKPWPIRKLQDLPGGWGIMLDDVAAGVLAGAITYGIGRVV